MDKHTKAPWFLAGERPQSLMGEVGFNVVDGGGFEVAELPNIAIKEDWHEKGLHHWSDDGGSIDRTDSEVKANAHLISAAPELLEALERLVAVSSIGSGGTILDDARAAIKKAKGTTEIIDMGQSTIGG